MSEWDNTSYSPLPGVVVGNELAWLVPPNGQWRRSFKNSKPEQMGRIVQEEGGAIEKGIESEVDRV